MKKVGLVLEGGAMRGIYTAGVLDFFLEKNLYLPYVIGVSAGACQALSYISNQPKRSKDVTLTYIRDPRYLSFRNLITEQSIFGMSFMFNEIPEKFIHFDYNTFNNSNQEMVCVATNCNTGNPEYFYKNSGYDMFKCTQASISMPLVSKYVVINNEPFLDGGLTDPIPVLRSIKDGNEKNIIVLTRDAYYRKKIISNTLKLLLKRKYHNYKKIITAMEQRHKIYNITLDLIKKLEYEGKAIVIRPNKTVKVKRMERDINKLKALYDDGYQDAKKNYDKIISFI